MLVYLIKSGACLGILFLFYKLFLEKENMHIFKRIYLLASLVIALIIPALVFTEYVEAPAPIDTNVQSVASSHGVLQVPAALEADILDIAPILWGIYFIGLLFFGIKFIKNLFQIFRRIQNNPKYRLARFTQVLLQEKIPPHTFFRYIFLNKKKLEANEIPKAVLLHEETHAQQKHSWDVVFVELLQVIFWVNPFIYLSKKAIKLNHEFLADQAVLKKDIDEITYQNTLLSYLSPDSQKRYQPTMANPITKSSYSSIKKRFKVMKTHTSRKSVLIKSLLLLPLLAMLLYGFSETKVETVSPQAPIENSSTINYHENIEEGTLTVRINKKGELFIEGQEVSMAAAESHVKDLMQHNRIIRALILPDSEAPIQIIKDVNSMLEQYEIASINIIGPEEPIGKHASQRGATKTQLATFNKLSKKYNKQPQATRVIPIEDLRTLEAVFRKMTDEQRKDAEPFPECTVSGDQEGANKEQLSEYNALAKKYNRQISKKKNIRIYKDDVERLEYLHGLMTHEQRENAAPFPDFPEPPPAPEAPKAPKATKGEQRTSPPPPSPAPAPAPNYEKLIIEKQESRIEEQEMRLEEREIKLAEQEIMLEEQESRIAEEDNLIKEQEIRMQERENELAEIEKETEKVLYIKEYADGDIGEPSTPPAPKSPIEHVIEMAKKDAIFYHEDKQISSDEAIAILKNNKQINIDSRSITGKRPVIKLSKEPIQIEN